MSSTNTPEYQHDWYMKHRTEHIAKAIERHKANPEKALKAQKKHIAMKMAVMHGLKNVPCMDCHQRFPPECMDFDHRDPAQKSFGIMGRVPGLPLQKLLDEAAKCDVVCANCHRIRTKNNR